MIIYLKKSTLFTIDPDLRFSKQNNDPKGTLKDIYRRHQLLEYTVPELCEFYTMKTGKTITPKSMKRWLWRIEIYKIAQPAMQSGTVVSSYFKKHEWRVIKELLKNIKHSVHKKSKTII